MRLGPWLQRHQQIGQPFTSAQSRILIHSLESCPKSQAALQIPIILPQVNLRKSRSSFISNNRTFLGYWQRDSKVFTNPDTVVLHFLSLLTRHSALVILGSLFSPT